MVNCACAWMFVVAIAAAEPTRPPNVVLILADDIGYGDLGCYGATLVKTPNLDRLAKEGRRFTDAHSPASTCSPTRRALLTGVYSWRRQPGSAIMQGDAPLSIPPGTPTMASILRSAGYKTGVVGKWHLGLGGAQGPQWNDRIAPGPAEIGFDYSFLVPATGDRTPCVYVENQRAVGLDPADPIQVKYGAKIGSEPTGKENPELLKLRATHGHDMTIVNGVGRIGFMTGGKSARWKDEDMSDTLARKATDFIADAANGPFFLFVSTHGIHVPRVPHPRFVGTSTLGARGDAIHELDDLVGQVLRALEAKGILDDTLVVFTSDNGGVLDDGYEDFKPTAHKMNGDLRGAKGTLYEGGHRVPFLARYPKAIPAGSECAALVAHLDLPKTFAAATGAKVPAGACADGFDQWNEFVGKSSSKPIRETFVAHVGGVRGPFAVRHGDWKLLTARTGAYGKQAKKKGPAEPELFNLKDDPSERRDLAKSRPEVVTKLRAVLAESGAGTAAK